MNKVFLASWDYLLSFKIYDCNIIREVISKNNKLKRKNFYLVNIPMPLFNEKQEFLQLHEFLILARFDEELKINSQKFPLYVYLGHIKSDYKGKIDFISPDDFVLDITAELYDTFENAKQLNP